MLIITGFIRSGTSPLAKMAHQMGIEMGKTTNLPAPGTEVEYEDYDIICPLSNAAFENVPLPNAVEMLRQYFRGRRLRQKVLRELYAPEYIKGHGLKCPYLLLYWDELKKAAELEGEPLKSVLSYRPISDVQKSIEAVLNRMNQRHRREWGRKFASVLSRMRAVRSRVKQDADLEIALSETRTDPTIPATKIADLMGIELTDPASAVRGIF